MAEASGQMEVLRLSTALMTRALMSVTGEAEEDQRWSDKAGLSRDLLELMRQAIESSEDEDEDEDVTQLEVAVAVALSALDAVTQANAALFVKLCELAEIVRTDPTQAHVSFDDPLIVMQSLSQWLAELEAGVDPGGV